MNRAGVQLWAAASMYGPPFAKICVPQVAAGITTPPASPQAHLPPCQPEWPVRCQLPAQLQHAAKAGGRASCAGQGALAHQPIERISN